MPATFLTVQERNDYEKIHLKDETYILQCFFPTTDDKHFLHYFNGKVNQVAIFIQIGLIRLRGYLIPDWDTQIDEKILRLVTQQLYNDREVINLIEYSKWTNSRSRHLLQILKYLQYRRWGPILDEPIIEKWLLERRVPNGTRQNS